MRDEVWELKIKGHFIRNMKAFHNLNTVPETGDPKLTETRFLQLKTWQAAFIINQKNNKIVSVDQYSFGMWSEAIIALSPRDLNKLIFSPCFFLYDCESCLIKNLYKILSFTH